ncbi:SDR family NAD(P)-dependent oxidoreductase [Rickettsiales bacterium]|nr:SDR family NAD(P)-dependent oxidoreductase [Rickettsiales bacterium]
MPTIYENKKRYLVTGGCGFIGSHLVDALVSKGHKVFVLDDLSTGKKENLNPKATLIIGDVTDYNVIEEVVSDIDGCFHLAAIASVEKSTTEWVRSHTVNVTATVNIFQAISRLKKHIPMVYTSSAAVYGDCRVMPIAESTKAAPLTSYGVDKFSCDLHGRVAWNVHKIPNIGLRPFNVYGPRQDPSSPYSGVISIFANRILRGEIINIYGNGEQIRDFVYVSDAVKAFIASMDSLEYGKYRRKHDEINVCTGKATSINKLAEIISEISGCKMYRAYKPARKGDIFVSVGDPAYLEARLKTKLTTKLIDGLAAMIGSSSLQATRKAG